MQNFSLGKWALNSICLIGGKIEFRTCIPRQLRQVQLGYRVKNTLHGNTATIMAECNMGLMLFGVVAGRNPVQQAADNGEGT